MLPNCELVSCFGNQYLVFKGRDLISNALKTNGYEVEVFAVSQKLLERHKDGIVLDIGANLGSFTVPLAKANQRFTFHAFEPQRIIYYQLCANTFINGLDTVYCHNTALSDHFGTAELTVPDYASEVNIGAFSIDDATRENEYECQTSGTSEMIGINTLDSYQYKDVRLVKVDVEGHELEALKGATETLAASNYPPIIFEAWNWKPWFEPKRKELFQFLQDMGYQIIEGGNNNIAQHPKFGDMLA